MAGQAGGGPWARGLGGWDGLGVTLSSYFNRRPSHLVSFLCVSERYGFFLIDLLSDLCTDGRTEKLASPGF
jgi:hypothetical protein